MILKILCILPVFIFAQIENQVRDDNPGLFKNQRLYHNPPNPLLKGRSHTLIFLTNIPKDSIISSNLFFKTNLLEYYQEIKLEGKAGLFEFIYEPIKYPGERLQYYFIINTEQNLFGTPLNDDGELQPVDKLLIDPSEYFKQRSRLNK